MYKTMTSHLSRFAKDESGATAIEYGLIAALVSVAIIAAVTSLGEQLSNTFESISSALGGTNASSTTNTGGSGGADGG